MKDLFSNPTFRTVLGIGVIVAIIGSIGTVIYLGQINKSTTLKGTKSKASTNTLVATISGCRVDVTLPTPTLIPTQIPPTPTTQPTPIPTVTPPTCQASPADIIISLDRSGSMRDSGTNGKSKLTWEKEAAIALVDVFSKQPDAIKNNVRIGVVSWAGNNYKVNVLGLTSDFNAVKNFIAPIVVNTDPDPLKRDDDTCIECGLGASLDLLSASTARKQVVLMSDGIGNKIISSCNSSGVCVYPQPPSCTNDQYLSNHCAKADTDAIKLATTMKSEGVDIFVVGYGTKSPMRILEDNLKSIAGSSKNTGKSYYHYGGSESDWINVFTGLAPEICAEIVTTPTKAPTSAPTGIPTSVPTPISCNKDLDISIVLDRSSSMTANDTINGQTKKKLEWAKLAASNIVTTLKNINASSVGVSVSSFGSQGNFTQLKAGKGAKASSYDSTLDIALTTQPNVVLTGIPKVSYKKPGTCVQCGIKIGNTQLTDSTAKRVVVLISDGMANSSWDGKGWISSTNNPKSNAINEATAGRASGIEYRVIGYGSKKDVTKSGSIDQIDEATLVTIAGGVQNYQYRNDAAGWTNSFMNILNDVCK